MQEWYKPRIVIYFFIFILLFSVAYSLEECRGTVTYEDVPCYILLPGSSCSTINVTFYNQSTELYYHNMAAYSPFMCNATFNQSHIGTYNFKYSTGDTGSIVVTEGYMRLWIYISAFMILGFLLLAGYYYQNHILHLFAGFFFPVLALDVFFNGFPTINDMFMVNSISIVLAGVGLYYLIAPSLEFIEEWKA